MGLVLHRYSGEEITVEVPGGLAFRITASIDRGKIKFYFDAPTEVRILRSELLERNRHEQHATTHAAPPRPRVG